MLWKTNHFVIPSLASWGVWVLRGSRPHPSSASLPIRPLGSAVLSWLRGRQLVKSISRGEAARYLNGKKKKFPFQWKTGHGWFFPGLMLSARTQIPSLVALSNTPIYKTTILGTEQHIHDYFLLGILITQGIELPASEIWSNNVKQKLVMQNVPLEII